MNQGTLWTVVKPTVGLPLLLGGVTVIAILVHLALLSNTTWFPKYWQGGARRGCRSGGPGCPGEEVSFFS